MHISESGGYNLLHILEHKLPRAGKDVHNHILGFASGRVKAHWKVYNTVHLRTIAVGIDAISLDFHIRVTRNRDSAAANPGYYGRDYFNSLSQIRHTDYKKRNTAIGKYYKQIVESTK